MLAVWSAFRKLSARDEVADPTSGWPVIRQLDLALVNARRPLPLFQIVILAKPGIQASAKVSRISVRGAMPATGACDQIRPARRCSLCHALTIDAGGFGIWPFGVPSTPRTLQQMIYLETLPVRETSITGVRKPSVKGGFPLASGRLGQATRAHSCRHIATIVTSRSDVDLRETG